METEKSMFKKKVLVVGLDGGEPSLIKMWAKEGKLPNLAKFLMGGVVGNLTTILPPISAPAWASFMTGKNPGKHGMFDFVERQPGSYERFMVNARCIHAKTLWTLLGEAGKKVIVINVPLTYPPEKVNGIMISGMLTPFQQSWAQSAFVHPASLSERLREEIGDYRVDMQEIYVKGKEDVFLKDLYHLIKKRAEVTKFLMKNYDWDFFMIVFVGTDRVQHFFWNYMDPTHPNYDHDEAKKYGKEIFRIYKTMDDIIGEILHNTDDETTVIVMSDHGFGPLHKAFYINSWLIRLDLLELKETPIFRIRYRLIKRGLTKEKIQDWLLSLGLKRLVKAVALSRINLLHASWISPYIEWTRTRAYSIGRVGFIFMNLKGREPKGIVEPGEKYEKLRNYIIKKLYKLRDPETGKKIVERVFKREEVYWGPYLLQAPDLLFTMKGYLTHEFGLGGLTGLPDRTGAHTLEGVLMMKGKNTKKKEALKKASIMDVTPTILYLMDVPIPHDMDGKVLTEAFNSAYLKMKPIRYKKITTEIEQPTYTYSKEEEEEIRKRLKRLGYLG